MSEEKVHEYSNDEITVIWKPEVCAHAGECVKGSPEVFKPNDKPWVQIDQSSTEAIVKTVDKCPSGALSYQLNAVVEEPEAESVTLFKIKATKNGPFLISGNLAIEDGDGNVKVCEGTTNALCRCGASRTKPFCDGSHSNIKFFG